ncbi:MAG: hypothetical protein HRU37_11600 [Roseibacillus sp.]|nr:hypothetical protein [Roseibacillus sp.]
MLEFIATACAGIFAGAAIFVSAVQHPASFQAGTPKVRALWRHLDSKRAILGFLH